MMMTLRASLYTLARILGWVRAVQQGRLPQRVHNVIVGRLAARVLGRLWR